ncbi:MAG: tRNA (adenosine(37)-N6)-threonylcarbamoyltransferase complex dimerization subunit type 1 TsaB [Erythrobacter sp.]
MRTLAIETASEACSVALFDGEELIAHDHRVMGRGHAEQLVPMIAALPDRGRADRVLVSRGPGSFTGVRIGIATARALGFAWGAEVLGYPTLALVAAQAGSEHAGPVTVCMNGGHGEWFMADFAGSKMGRIHSLTPDQAFAAGAQKVIAGNRAREFADLLGDERTVLDLLPDARATLALDEPYFTHDVIPIYGRGPDATPIAERAS